MLVRDLLGGHDEGLLDRLTVVVVPIFNPDGNDAMDTSNRALDIERLVGQHGPPRVGTRVNAAGIKRAALADLPLVHSSIVVDREALLDVGGYDERYRYAADTELFDRLFARYRAANVPKPLLGLRQHGNQGTRTKAIVDEGIDIMAGRLLSTNYSAEEAAIIRGVLSRSYVVRAHLTWGERKYRELLNDLLSGFRASPKKFWWYCGLLFVYYPLPERSRVKIRKFLGRILPGISPAG